MQKYFLGKNIRFIYEELQHAKSNCEMLLIADRFVADLIRHARKDCHLLIREPDWWCKRVVIFLWIG